MNPLNPIIKQLKELLLRCEVEMSKKPLSIQDHKDIRDRLKNLESKIALFTSVTEETLAKEKSEKKNAPPVQLTKRKVDVRRQLRALERMIVRQRIVLKPYLKRAKGKDEQQTKKKMMRKKKFRGLNPRGKWQKL